MHTETSQRDLKGVAKRYLWRVAQIFTLFGVLTLIHRARGVYLVESKTAFGDLYDLYPGASQMDVIWIVYGNAITNGLQADILFCLCSALLLPALPRVVRIAATLALIIFYAANLEHIHYNLAHIDFGLLGLGADGTFLLAQFTEQLAIYLAVFALFAVIVAAIQWMRIGGWLSVILTVLIVPFAALPLASFDPEDNMWLQTHPLVPTFSASNLADDPRQFDIATPTPLAQLPDTATRQNVLIVYLEGVSHHSIAKADMATLRGLSDRYTTYDRYFAHQLITANGLYATLLGDYPLFTSPDRKWSLLQADDPLTRTALPAVLRDAGYQTAFVQSADLSYMQKDRVLPLIGFDQIAGDADIDPNAARSGWGVNDMVLFDKVIETIDGFDPHRPWMLATLTTGTHSPYNVPDDFAAGENRRIRALKFADEAVAQLLADLEARDLLDDTLVIITSDESREAVLGSRLTGEVALNWLPLIVIEPDALALRVSDYVVSTDLPALVMAHLDGRTFAPSQDRAIILGNIIAGRVNAFDQTSGELVSCRVSDFACLVYRGITDLGDVQGSVFVGQAMLPAFQDQIEALEE
ncbi:LTA synthase family protein [Yoonia sp. 208BN28-4]|uniref:LTA synthase family protein n=1 Tax=Yoonia sp. 208BN28-4 TaxID=3126505 RepID=UPI0030953A9F